MKHWTTLALLGVWSAAAFLGSGMTAQAENLKVFWLTETITETTTGPILAKPGTRFVAAGDEWIILASQPGQILFSSATSSHLYGPFSFEKMRIIDLGDKAAYFSKIEHFTGENPATVHPVVTLQPPERTTETTIPQKAEIPQGWEQKPFPSTNPGDHLNRPKPFSMETRVRPPAIVAWFEPIRDKKYDWSVGDYSGNSGEELETARIGLSGNYRNWFVEIARITDAKTSGTLVPDGIDLSHLRLSGGSGFSVAGGHLYSFVIDENWNANIGGMLTYESLSFDMTGTSLTPHGKIISENDTEQDAEDGGDSTTPYYEFENYTESVSIDELTLTAIFGIDYTTWYWGIGVYFTLNLYSDADFSGSIQVRDDIYELNVDRTDPIGVELAGWYSPFADYQITGKISVGTETAIRIGIGKSF